MKVATVLLVCAFVHGQSIELNQNGCPIDYSKEKLYAHEDCNKYYQCTHGNLVERICFMELLFNVDEQKCDWPHDVDCGNRIIPGENDNGNGDGNGSGNGNGNGSGNGNNGNESGNNGNGGGSENGNGENNGSCNCECSCPGPNENGNENGNENDNGDSGSGGGGDCDNGNGNGDNGNGNGDNGNGNGENGDGDNGNGGNDGSCNCNPGEAPSICKRPGSDNVLIAHEVCNKFYKCAHGIPVPQYCPGILLYNPHIGVCDWPQNVDCGDRIIADSNENGNGNGDGGNGDGNGDNGNGNGDNGNGNGDNGDGDNGNGGNDGSCNCNPGEAPSICRRPGSDNVLVAHEDCNKFYKCAHGIPVPQDCPGILLYNPHIGVCDWPQNVDCGDRIIPDPNENGDCSGDGGNGDGNGDNGNGNGDNGNGNGDNGNGNGDNGNGNGDNGDGDNGNGGNDDSCNCNPGEAPSICRRPGSDNVLVAHEDCNKFYKCAHGIPVPQDCPGTLLYNPHIGVCDWPQNVDCGDRIIPDPNENGDEGNGDGNGDSGNGNGDNGNGNGDNGNGNGDNGDGGNDGSCNCNPGEAPSICGRPGSDNVLVAHEDCNKFYKCAYGIPVPQDCPGVLLYNPHIRVCDWPQNVDCGDRIIPDSNENGNDNGDGGNGDGNGDNGDGNGDNDNGNVDGGDGGGNNSNENGNSNEDISCEDSSNEENNNGNNNGSCNCNPQEAVPICQQHGSDGIHVAHEHCTKYYRCISGIAVPMPCPKGLYYNPYDEGCDWPNNVDCADRIIPDPDDIDSVEDIDSDENKDIIICNCDPKEAPLICARNNSRNVLVASENCNQYYICDNGKPTIRDCPDNLLYNPYKEVCDWPQDVDCGDRVIPDPKEIDNGNEGGNENSSESEINRPCNCDPDQAEAICAAENSESTMIAHQICNKYYICNFGLPVVQKCQGNLLYNPHKEVCDWSANVDCGNRLIPQPNDTDTGSCNCSPKEAPLICAHENSNGVVIAHENCHQYYKCLNRRPMVLSCFSSYLFDPFKQKCDKPENVNCGHRFRINDNN